jgi:hypothetical protein
MNFETNFTTLQGGSMRPLSYLSLKLFVLLMVVSSPFTQTEGAAKTFPYIQLKPSQPVALTDTVRLQIMLGTASNSCWAPTFSNCSFVIEQSPLAIYPPLFNVKVKFTLNPVPKDRICTDVYNPVDYGPLFILGVLKLGAYQVSIDTTIYGTFSVVEGPIPVVGKTLKGRVYDDPYPLKIASNPIPNAKIHLVSGPIPIGNTQETAAAEASSLFISDSTVTNNAGEFSFAKLQQGLYDLTCMHKDFRTITLRLRILSDTSVYLTMVPNSAHASVKGLVTVVGSDGGMTPLEGCNIVVYKGIVLSIVGAEASSDILISTMTDKDGKYAIDSIPIGANGEIEYVHAFKGDRYVDYQKVALYNMKTETVDFKFAEPYQNSDSVVVRGIVFKTATNKYSYRKDEPVKIRYSVANTTDQQVAFGAFDGGCEYDLSITMIPAITIAEKVLYRQSAQALICYDTLSYIIVNPHQAVVKNFPDYYLPDLTSFAPTNNKIMLMVSAQLRGQKYDSTKAGVPIEIRLEPTAVAENKGASGRLPSSCKMQDHALALSLLRAQNVSVNVYGLDGRMHPNASFTRNLLAGTHTLSLTGLMQIKGMCIVGVKGADFEKVFSVVNVKN